ncbi:olfactory receptor 14J1-like, partial [Nothoprocta perdicaria]|uniref:olfactory receptor 14J1-like n=1 Tax=Nothoprocta perdicaria TaxID=30464 RepID=UPI000E1B99E9
MSNSSSFNEFLLLAFSETRELQLLHFAVFLCIYLFALLGNGLIITAIVYDHHLHSPMYFFLLNLSVLDMGSISTTVPKSMANSLLDTRAISHLGCAAQVFFLFFLLSAEGSLLTVMAYDHFAAICRPLHYEILMSSRPCARMAAAAWGHTIMIAYLKPPYISSPSLDLGVAVLYVVVPPAMNPLIYSLRNKELKDALRKLLQR